jgi:hypothetical protein
LSQTATNFLAGNQIQCNRSCRWSTRAARNGRAERAFCLLAAVEATRTDMGAHLPMPPWWQERIDRAATVAGAEVSAARSRIVAAAGRALDRTELIKYACDDASDLPAAEPGPLSKR